jgi:calcineurin-like phosphoesterase family protein
MQWKHPSSPTRKMFKVTPSAGKIMRNIFWDSQGVLLAHFSKRGKNINSASYCEVLLRFRMQYAENVHANSHEGYCFIMIMPDSIQPKQPRREFKNYSGNFLNIRLTARTWPLVTSICLFP